jgi:hypothetical protein
MGKNLEGNNLGLIEILFWHSPGGTEENDEKFQSGKPVSQPIFEPGTLQM